MNYCRVWILLGAMLCMLAACSAPEEPEPAEPTLPANPYAMEDFVVEASTIRYTGPATAYVGIDVSTHQGEIDWQAVADSGVDFAIIRIGYRGYTEGGLFTDDMFEQNITQAQAAGVQTGVYFFSQAVSVEEAMEEAEFVCEQLEHYNIPYPVMFDWEKMDDTRSADVDYATVTDCARAFCSAVQAEGYTAGVYFNLEMSKFMDMRQLQDYVLWLADYNDYPTYAYTFDCWQYTHTGQVDGIGVDTDLNIYFEEA